MNRDLATLTDKEFDLLVIGGGIHGAFAAWDAALRGFSVALIERRDFGCATSQNSLKVVHGGLRYLQDGNLARIRVMARERSTWLNMAPHLVNPLRCVTPTFSKLTRGRLAMRAALTLNDLISFDRNKNLNAEKRLPGGRIIPAQECGRLLPGLDIDRITGAAVWHDGHIHNTERMLLAVVESASRAGAAAANYVEATGLMVENSRVVGVHARDTLSGEAFDIQARVTLNCAGAWIDGLMNGYGRPADERPYDNSVALNLVTRQIWSGAAAGLPSRPGGPGSRAHMFFIVPWQGHSIIGTWHIPWREPPDQYRVSKAVLEEFIAAVNCADPCLSLTLEDVRHVHWGFLPMVKKKSTGERVKLVREGKLIDHQVVDGIGGLVTILGVKYTTARVMAERGVDLAQSKLGRQGKPCQTAQSAVAGGEMDSYKAFLQRASAEIPAGLDAEIIEHLASTYGSDYGQILALVKENPALGQRVSAGKAVLRAEVIHAVREEMAMTLADVIERRTELGAYGLPERAVLAACADQMGDELGWDSQRKAAEIEGVTRDYPLAALDNAIEIETGREDR